MSWLFPGMEGGPRRRRGDGHPVLLGVAGVCLLLFLIFVVVSVIIIGAGKSLDLCNVRAAEDPSGVATATLEWNWIPPYPECVRRSGDSVQRENVVFDPVTGTAAVLLILVAAATFGWWLVLTVREAEKIADEKSSG